ncbi:MAG: iron ABC transporter permease [Acidimicrobiales bacterium]|nr:iron ABC transporter permease [Acidimicrobiales bacterium]
MPVVFLVTFFAWPVAAILREGLWTGGRLDLAAFGDVVADPYLRHVAWFTLGQAVLSTVLTLVVALPGAYVLARYRFAGRSVVRALVTVPFVLPTVVVGTAFLAVLGPGGPLGSLGLRGTVWAILIAHVFFNYAVVVRTVGGLWAHLDPAVEDAARTLGAGPLRLFRQITLPLLAPAIAAAGSIVFLFTFTTFGVVLVLGGPRTTTLDVEIWRQTTQLLDLRVAAVLAVLQLVAVAAVLVVQNHLVRRRTVRLRLRPEAVVARRPTTPWARALVAANLALMAVLLGAPLAVLVERSVSTPSGYGLAWYRDLGVRAPTSTLFVPPAEAIRNSLAFAVLATVLAVTVGGCAAVVVARRRGLASQGLEAFVLLPLGTSAVIVGFGFLVALDTPPLDLRSRPILIPIAHALVGIPFVVRLLVPVIEAIDHRLREAATVLGAPPRRVWREIDLPLTARTGLVAAGFAAAVSLGEFGATAFIARPDTPTVPVAIVRLLGRPGPANVGQAMALSVILMALTAVVILAVERFRLGDLGEF